MALKFTTDLNFKFIKIYREYECLWRTDCEQYRDKQCRDNAIAKIIDRMGMPDLNESEVKKKIKSLRSTYLTEVKKIQDSLRSGASGDSIYKPKIPWFSLMNAFIKYVENEWPTQNVNEFADNDSDLDESTLNQKRLVAPKVTKNSQPPVKRNRLNEVRNILRDLRRVTGGIPQQPLDEFEIYGTYVASQLRQLSLEQGIIARENIHSILTQSRLHDLRSVQSNRFASPDHSSVVENASIYSNSEDLNMSHQLTSSTSPLSEKKPIPSTSNFT